MNKKHFLFFVIFIFVFANSIWAANNADSTKVKIKQPLFIPSIGISLLSGGWVKMGTMVRITNTVYAEFDYAFWKNKDEVSGFEYNTAAHKYNFGINYFNKRHTFFQNIMIRKSTLRSTIYTIDNTGKNLFYNGKTPQITYLSYNVGWNIRFTKQKHTFGISPRVGIVLPPYIFGIFPFNGDISFFYTI